ncbi:M28 family peptidase [Moorella naiadis]|uniref:M28 family metallopeptidase n=1 Tax=Moorella naiadis (nom. illeg.) TaxID=3093670 RepID=UPI003D9CBD4E
MGKSIELKVAVQIQEETGYNIRALPRGTGLAEGGRILIFSHYDSMWLGPHAMDNATGTAAVMQLIDDFADCNLNLEFIFFGAEELGFWGSRDYILRHRQELGDFKAVVCLDGIASDRGEVEIGVSQVLKPLVKEVVQATGITVRKWSVPPRPNSDHLPFEEIGIPVFWLTTMDNYYHTAGDLPDVISASTLEKRVRLARDIIKRLAIWE